MTLQVKTIRVQRFKNIKDISLDLDATTILVGANNSGKSAVLQSIQFVTSAAQCVGPDGLQAGNPTRSATISPTDLYYSPVDEVMTLAHGSPLTQNLNQAIQLDFTLEDTETAFHLAVAKGRNGNLTISTSGGAHWKALSSLERPFSMYVPGLAGIAPAEPYLTPAAVRKAAARGHGNSVLRNVLWQLRRDDLKWRAFETQLQAVFPGHLVQLDHSPETDDSVYASIAVDGIPRPIGLAGTGLLQTLQILAYVNLYSPSLLLLDEPDSHIHPDKQRALLGVVTNWAGEQGAKVIIATHSRHLLDSMDGAASFHWMQRGTRRSEEDFDRVKVLMDLGALDRSDRLKNGDVATVVLSEDAQAADAHKKSANSPLRRLLAANGANFTQTQVWSYEGCTQIHTAKVLASFIVEHAPGARVLVHRDRDYLSDEEVDLLVKDFSLAGIDLFITSGTDVESYFINPAHLAQMAGISMQEAGDLIAAATAETNEDSLDSFSRAEMAREKVRRREMREGGEPSPRAVADDCRRLLDATPERFRHGKKTLKALRRLVQERYGVPTDLLEMSPHIAEVGQLRSFFGAAAKMDTNIEQIIADAVGL